MSLAGIAISIGVLVDGAIVEVENAYKKIEVWIEEGRKGDFHEVRLEALTEVGPSVFFSLLVIAVSFLPVFTLVDQEGRLFTPLAWTKTLAIALASILAVTLDPAVRMLFARVDPFPFQKEVAEQDRQHGDRRENTIRRKNTRSARCSSGCTRGPAAGCWKIPKRPSAPRYLSC